MNVDRAGSHPHGAAVLVTGASRGIGRHVAQHLLDLGYHVTGVARSPAPWAADRFSYEQADVTSEAAMKRIIAGIEDRFGGLWAAVNVAGVGPAMNPVLLTPAGSVLDFARAHLLGRFIPCREAARVMRRRNEGRIVNIGSVAAQLRIPGEAAYGASMRAVEAFSQILARELAHYGITVNVVGPAPTPTDALADIPAEKIEALLAGLPIRRPGRPSDVANVVEFFLRRASAAVTAQIVYLGGVPNG